MHSPFQFLTPFSSEGSHAFFGRTDEVSSLFEFVTQHRLTVVNGTIGSGKTSLIRSGLSTYFTEADWLPLFIRRGTTFIESLREELLLLHPTASADASVFEWVAGIQAARKQPLCLIFDQIEEMLQWAGESEFQEFIYTIRQLSEDPELDCHVMLILREEFPTRTIFMAKEIPSILDCFFGLAPMSEENMLQVILHSARQFNISLENPEENATQILAVLKGDYSDISLSFLQVYLDRLWRDCFQRTYPDMDKYELESMLAAKKYPALTITAADIEGFGSIEAVLARFLADQTTQVEEALRLEGLDTPDLVGRILDCFVKEDGTLRHVPFFFQQMEVCFGKEAPEFLQSIPRALATNVFRLLTQHKVLYFAEDISALHYRVTGATPDPSHIPFLSELTHDGFGPLIARQRSEAETGRNKMVNQLMDTYRGYLEDNARIRMQLKEGEEILNQFAEMPSLGATISGDRTFNDVRDLVNRIREGIDNRTEVELREYAKVLQTRFSSLSVLPDNDIHTFYGWVEMGKRQLYTLNHADALLKFEMAAGLVVPASIRGESLTAPLSELLFFFAKGGRRFDLARKAAGLLLESEPSAINKGLLHRCIQEEWSSGTQFESLLAALPDGERWLKRYYPTMRRVPTGMDGVPNRENEQEQQDSNVWVTPAEAQLAPFEIAETALTFYQFALFCESTNLPLLNRTPLWGQYGDHPMVNVGWTEAVAYANWLSAQHGLPLCYAIDTVNTINNTVIEDQTNYYWQWTVDWEKDAKGYRLPTDNEWYLAALGGVGARKYAYFGGDNLDEVGWYNLNSGVELLTNTEDGTEICSDLRHTHPVGEKKPNALGLYDMSGNVFEWCWDDISLESSYVQDQEDHWYCRMARGGAWSVESDYASSDKSMYIGAPGHRDFSIGFRLVRTV
ncbi:MAG: SUMF1/EgtB/PvdO family nonheme iron enzyme [Haliscomenobacter sp.]